MKHLNGSFVGVGLTSLLLAGCYATEVDPTLTSVFACNQKDDDCPNAQRCVNHRCEDEEIVPRITITEPEDEFRFNDAPLPVPGMPPPRRQLVMQFSGELELVAADSGAEHVFGEGHVVISIDGEEQAIVDSGNIGTPLPLMVDVAHQPGPHRITAQAMRNDGTPYDNPQATGTRLFWIQSELVEARRPFVAIKSPWPGSSVQLDDTTVDVELSTINFDMRAPLDDAENADGVGHAHIYYDQLFPDCLMDPLCDGGYIGVVGESLVVPAPLPESAPQAITLTAVLRQIGHDPYRFPFGCEPVLDDPVVCEPVTDTITINRADL